MLSFLSLYITTLIVVASFNKWQLIGAGRDDKHTDDLTENPDFGPFPPKPGESGSQVPPNWKWKTVLVDDLCSDNPYVRNQADSKFKKNTLYSILSNQESEARIEYETKEQEHIRNKQALYNENMKNKWKKDRMDSLSSRCIILK